MYKQPCPFHRKYELVNWCVNTLGYTRSRSDKLSKAQLYAIWYKNAREEADKASKEYAMSLSTDDQYELKQLIRDEIAKRDLRRESVATANCTTSPYHSFINETPAVSMTTQLCLLMDDIWEGKETV
jgi:hypothetical protein